jgi:OmpA family protein/Calx-beta domain-containing protein
MQWGTLLLAASLGGFGVGIANAEAPQSLAVPFVANDPGVDSRVALYARMPSGTLFVGKDGALTYLLTAQDRRGWALKEHFVRAKTLSPRGREPSATHVSRFTASGDAGNAVSMAAYQWADIGEVWPGIAIDVKASGENAEKFFHLAPKASVSDIKIAIDGAQHLKINRRGELAVATGLGEAVFSQPVAWQELGGKRRTVHVKYALLGSNQYGFSLDAYDHRRELIIDPLLQSTYIGGTGGQDHVAAIAINSTTGDVYVTGTTSSTSGFPVSAGALQATAHSAQDAFIALLPANLKSFTQVTFYGGSLDDEGQAILIHPNGDIYMAGYTGSHDLTGMAGGAFATNTASFGSAYLIRLDPTLTTLRQGTYYGNNIQGMLSTFELLKLAADATGAVYLAGAATTTTLPGTAGGAIPTVVNGRPGFIAKFSGDLKTLIQATYVTGGVNFLGLSAQNSIGDIVVEPSSGDVLIAGTTDSLSMPVTSNAFQKTLDPDMIEGNGFVARLPNTLKSFIALSYVTTHSSTPQSSHGSAVVSMALHPINGDIYVYGGTDGDLLDGSAGAYVPTTSFNSPAEFMMRVAPDLSAIHNATFLGLSGSGPAPFSIRIAATGDVYTAGYQCADTTGGLQPGAGGQGFLCIARWSPNLSSLVQATRIGSGRQDDFVAAGVSESGAAFGIGIANDVYLAGGTISNNYPGTSAGAQATFAAGSFASGYIARITADLQGVPQPGTLQFSAATYSVADNAGPAHILVNRSNGSSGSVTVTVTTGDGTGKAGSDYTATTQVLTFADGDIAPKLFSVPVQVDAAKAGNKTVNLTLSAATGGATIGTQSAAVLTITPTTAAAPGSLQFSASTYSVADSAGNASITVTRSGGSAGAVAVSFATSDGTGKAGTNYTATTQTVTFADGDATAKTIGVPVKVSGTVGNSFTVDLALSGASGGAALGSPATAVLTVNATTTVVVPPPPPPLTNTVTVTGKGGGGAVASWEIALLGALLVVRVLRTRRLRLRWAGMTVLAWAAALAGAIGIAPQAKADSPQVYAGFGIGQARSVATASDLERKLDTLGFPGANVSLDDHKLAGKIYGGVSLNQYLSLEAAYVDLNKVRTHSTAATSNPPAFVAAVTAIHPYSARGGSVSALASLPLVGGLSVFARGGGFVWHGEIDADIPNIDATETKKTGVSAVAGAGVDFAFTRQFALRAEWERYFITRDSMDLLTVGVRVKF